MPPLTLVGLLAFGSPAAAAGTWQPGSGDVDLDGRVTTLDALQILESASWPAADRARLRGWMDACDVTRDGTCDGDDANQIFLTVITDWNDYDGDGVPNASDCAVLDGRLAADQVFYVDRDLDHVGSSYEAVLRCTAAAEPPLVPWDGDTDDYTQAVVPVPVTKGGRSLGVDLTHAAQAGAWRMDLAQELGIDATLLNLDWSLIETSPGVFDGPQAGALAVASAAYGAAGLKLSLAVNPIAHGMLTLPADLKADVEAGRLRFSDPRFIERYTALLSFVRGALPTLPLVSFQVGWEIDRFLGRGDVPAYFWDDYGVLLSAARMHAKMLWGSAVPVGTTATSSALIGGRTEARLATLNTGADIVSATYTAPPAGYVGTASRHPRVVLEQLIAHAHPKPVHLQSIEYPSAPAGGGSESRQSLALRSVFDAWDLYPESVPYIGFGRLHDRAPSGDALADSLGLRTWDGEGRAKIAYRTLRNEAFERGWWRMPAPLTRSFDLGFTPALYDAPPASADYVAMLDWIAERSAADGSFYNLHLDNGVPWLEAEADDFSWPLPPYSPYLRTMWQAFKDRIPPGQKLLVSVNPTGVPRDVIAPYFGVGEGFSYNDAFERVGDGIIADYENRLPPAPWNGYDFDHPSVKKAFASYCRRVIQFFQPDYLVVSIETTATMHEDPEAYARLVALVAHVRAELEARPETRDVTLMVSLSATSFMTDEFGVPLKREEHGPHKRNLQIQGVMDIAPHVDGFALSFYPHYSKWNATYMQASMFDGLWSVLGSLGKRVGFSETGWPAESFDVLGSPFFSDEEKQTRFLKLLFAESERAPVPVDFIVNFRTRDGDYQWQRLRDASQQVPPTVSPQFVEFYKYFRDIGLFDGDGQDRPATSTWREHLARPYQPRPTP